MSTVREIIERARQASSLAGEVAVGDLAALHGDAERATLPASELAEFVWPAELPPHLSCSQANTFATCPEQYRLSYIKRIKAPPKAYLVRGTADHKTAEQNFEQKIESHQDLPLGEIRERYAHNLDVAIDETNGEVDWEETSRDEVQKQGLEMAAVYHQRAAPGVQPVAVERKVEVVVPGLAIPVIGYVDVETDGYGLERKTKGKKVASLEPQWEAQGLFYAAAIGKSMRWHLIVPPEQLKTKYREAAVVTPEEAPNFTVHRDEASDERVYSWLRSTATNILFTYMTYGPEEPWPDVRFRRNHACGWCGYRYAGKCVAWGGSA